MKRGSNELATETHPIRLCDVINDLVTWIVYGSSDLQYLRLHQEEKWQPLQQQIHPRACGKPNVAQEILNLSRTRSLALSLSRSRAVEFRTRKQKRQELGQMECLTHLTKYKNIIAIKSK